MVGFIVSDLKCKVLDALCDGQFQWGSDKRIMLIP